MRSPHNPQPSLNLGDDPDPASELGPRLAATSQTVQGLLTNYLFYGQRRSNDRTPTALQGLAGEREHEQHSNNARASLADHTRRGSEANATDQREVPPGASRGPAVSQGSASGVPRLELVFRPEPSAEPSAPIAAGASTSPMDPLAEDALTDDRVAHDPLRPPSPGEPHLDHHAEPEGRLP